MSSTLTNNAGKHVLNDRIPKEVLLKIFSYLPLEDLNNFRTVSTQCKELIDCKLAEEKLCLKYKKTKVLKVGPGSSVLGGPPNSEPFHKLPADQPNSEPHSTLQADQSIWEPNLKLLAEQPIGEPNSKLQVDRPNGETYPELMVSESNSNSNPELLAGLPNLQADQSNLESYSEPLEDQPNGKPHPELPSDQQNKEHDSKLQEDLPNEEPNHKPLAKQSTNEFIQELMKKPPNRYLHSEELLEEQLKCVLTSEMQAEHLLEESMACYQGLIELLEHQPNGNPHSKLHANQQTEMPGTSKLSVDQSRLQKGQQHVEDIDLFCMNPDFLEDLRDLLKEHNLQLQAEQLYGEAVGSPLFKLSLNSELLAGLPTEEFNSKLQKDQPNVKPNSQMQEDQSNVELNSQLQDHKPNVQSNSELHADQPDVEHFPFHLFTCIETKGSYPKVKKDFLNNEPDPDLVEDYNLNSKPNLEHKDFFIGKLAPIWLEDPKIGIYPKLLQGQPRKESNSKLPTDLFDSEPNPDTLVIIETVNFQEKTVFNDHIPNEIFLKIFSYLPLKDLCKFRLVSKKWKELIDYKISEDELPFLYICEEEFPESFTCAVRHAIPGMSYLDIYKNLKAWKHLNRCSENINTLLPSSDNPDILSISTTEDVNKGVLLAVHKKNEIVYYDIDHKVHKIVKGRYLKYVENRDFIISLDFFSNLHIVWKNKSNPENLFSNQIQSISAFMLDDNVLHLSDNYFFYECHLNPEKFKIQPAFEYPEDTLVSIGCLNGLLSTFWLHEDVEEGKCINSFYIFYDLVRYDLSRQNHIICNLIRFNLIDNMNWRLYNLIIENVYGLEIPLSDITTAKVYGNHVFFGSNFGILTIYYVPLLYSNPQKIVPVKKYRLADTENTEIECTYPIIKIDVVEIKNGHKLYVAMPQKLVVINFEFE